MKMLQLKVPLKLELMEGACTDGKILVCSDWKRRTYACSWLTDKLFLNQFIRATSLPFRLKQ